MAEYVHVDLGPVLREVREQSAVLQRQINSVGAEVDRVNARVEDLAIEFQRMMDEQRKTAAVQQAATELVRIRQELDQEFGNYRVVRETMLGVLQATDLALVKETTISRVSEELMLATPDYWLAPCLVAVAAWIANNPSLADRAIAEAMRRDSAKTSLTMALICRRNGRTATCYEWLGNYFAKQDATRITESGYTCIDAYINGIFGPDEKHICDDYVSKWMAELKGADENFEATQENAWKGYLTSFHKSNLYPNLKSSVSEYDRIDAYVGRIVSVQDIRDNFAQIQQASVDDRQMKDKIDDLLIELVRQHTDAEQRLRDEEQIQMEIKENGGDVTTAKNHIAEIQRRRQAKAVNLIEQMSKAIRNEGDVSTSKKKTALSFLGDHIKKGFNSYIAENQEQFPQAITINVDGWSGMTVDGSNEQQLFAEYCGYMDNKCAMDKARIKENKGMLIAAIIAVIVGLVAIAAMGPVGPIIGLAVGAFCAFKWYRSKTTMAARQKELEEQYAVAKQNGVNMIHACIAEWYAARVEVYNFTSQPTVSIIA